MKNYEIVTKIIPENIAFGLLIDILEIIKAPILYANGVAAI